MPELPEAETIARQLHAALPGHALGPLRHVRLDIVRNPPAPLDAWLEGRGVISVSRRGKRVILHLTPPGQLIFRLGMSGRLQIQHRDAPIEKHTHFRIEISGTNDELRFRDPRRFGGIWVVTDGSDPHHDALGPEPLDITKQQFRQLLRRHRQIKALLMDQSTLAGMGNIYCDESLFLARIHPLTQADKLTPMRVEALRQSIRKTLRRAIRHKGSTLLDYRGADGEKGSFQSLHNVYAREKEPCPTCKTPIRRIIAAGRSTFFCPKCQRPPHKNQRISRNSS